MWKIIFSLVLVAGLLIPFSGMVNAQREPADLLDVEYWLNELLPLLRDNLIAFLPEAFWTFIRACICGGLIPSLLELPLSILRLTPCCAISAFITIPCLCFCGLGPLVGLTIDAMYNGYGS